MFDLFSDPVKVAQQLQIIFSEYGFATWESLVLEVAFAYVIGLPLGVILVTGEKEGIQPLPPIIMKTLNVIINLLRSVPFLILFVTIMPFTKAVVGTTIGPKAAIIALLVAAAPFVARMVESSLKEVEKGVIEAAQSMGASPFQIMTKVLLPEAKPALLVGSAISITTILGYSAMAGFVGAGGLGAIAINYGYHRSQEDIMYVMVILLVIIVQVFQELGMKISKKTDRRL